MTLTVSCDPARARGRGRNRASPASRRTVPGLRVTLTALAQWPGARARPTGRPAQSPGTAVTDDPKRFRDSLTRTRTGSVTVPPGQDCPAA